MDEMYGNSSSNISDFIAVNTSTTFCAARLLQRNYQLPLPQDTLAIVRAFQFLYFFALLAVGGVLNVAIVWSVARHKKIRTLDIVISLQIVIISLATIIVVVIPALVNVAAGEWVFGAYSCSILGFLEYTLRGTRRTLMVALVLDRFFLVFYPFGYQKYHKKTVIALSLISWVVSILFRVTGLPGLLDCYTISSSGAFCSFTARCSKWCAISGYVDFGIVHFPFYVLPVVLYSFMYKKGRKMARLENMPNSTASQIKASITFFLLFLTSFACNVPTILTIIIIQVVLAVQGYSLSLAITLFTLSHFILLLVVLDALVILRHKDIKDTLLSSLSDTWKKLTGKTSSPRTSQ